MKIRVGKNIYVSLVIKTSEGEPEDLSVARDLQVVVENKFTQEQYVPKNTTTNENVVMFEIPGGSIQVGIFDFHLSYKKDSLKSETGVEPYLLDFCDVIQIVECTCKETSKLTPCPSVNTESVTIEGVVDTDGQVDVVRWTKVQTDPPGTYRKEIVLPNDYLLSGATTDDRVFPLITLSKKDKVEVGTPEVPMNFNTPSGVRPTVTELGQAKAHEVAYLTDIPEQVEDVYVIPVTFTFSSSGGAYFAKCPPDTYTKLSEAINDKKAIVVNFSDPYSGINSYNLLAQSVQERTEDGKKYYDLYTVSQLPSSITKEEGLPFLMKVITITSNSVVLIDDLEGLDRELEPDIIFLNKGEGSKFLSDNGKYKEVQFPSYDPMFIDIKRTNTISWDDFYNHVNTGKSVMIVENGVKYIYNMVCGVNIVSGREAKLYCYKFADASSILTTPTIYNVEKGDDGNIQVSLSTTQPLVFKSDIRNNLTQEYENEGTVLDARQGRALKDMIDNLETKIQALESQNPLILEK